MISRRPGSRFNRGRIAVGPAAPGGGGGDTTPPEVVGNLVIASDGLSGVITLDEDCDETSVPDPGDFALNGTPVLVDGVSYTDATHLELTFDSPILQSETVTWDYTAGVNPIQDLAGNDLPNVSGGATDNGSGIEAELAVTTYYSNWSLADTEYLPHRSLTALVLAGGGGGDLIAGPVVATGGAGELRIVEITDAAVGGYSGTFGANGVAGSGGNATNGGNTTLSGPSGLLATAIGGGAGNASTNTAGSGGSGGSGGTGRSGGSGQTGVANAQGGATGGTSTDASGSTPGEPDGTPSTTGATPGPGAGGGVNTGASARDGGAGQCIVFYQRGVVASSRSRVVAMSWGRDVSAATTRDISVPGTHAANDRLVTNLGAAPGSTIDMSSWTAKYNDGAGACFVRDADGSDPVTVTTSVNRRVTWHATRVRGAAAVSNTTATGATVTTSQPNPPSNDHGSSVNAVWFACCAATANNSGVGAPAQPTNYTGMYVPPVVQTSNAASSVFVGMRPLLATQTEDPGEITFPVNVSGAAWTLCVPS